VNERGLVAAEDASELARETTELAVFPGGDMRPGRAQWSLGSDPARSTLANPLNCSGRTAPGQPDDLSDLGAYFRWLVLGG